MMLGLLCGCVALAFRYWEKLFIEPALALRTFINWSIKGVLLPMVAWIIFSAGLIPAFPPLWPAIPPNAPLMIKLTSLTLPIFVGTFVIGSYWLAVSLAWIACMIGMRTRQGGDFWGFFVLASLIGLPLGISLVYFGGLAQAGLALSISLLILVHFTAQDGLTKGLKPMYSRAIARMKFGKYNEAEREVLRQLEKCEDDFEGWMLLAELYARHFHELPEADKTIRELCAQPNLSPVQVSIALNKLAEWHLTLGSDPDAACAALVELCKKLPATHFAEMAKQRIAQLPLTREQLLEQREKKPIQLPALTDNLDDGPAPAVAELSKRDAQRLCNGYVEKLKKDPNDVPPREKLAMLLAENLGKAELGIDQLQLLIDMPEQPEKKIAEWLSLMARWQLKHRQDTKAAKAILHRIIRDHPQTPHAFAAQRWLNLLDLDWKFDRPSASEKSE